VHTGDALVVLDADASRGEGIAAGDVMNAAARLQGAAPVDGIVVGETTYRRTLELFEYEDLEPVHAKGKSEPLPVWLVTAERRGLSRAPARGPLVGREGELARLVAAWERACSDRRPQLVSLVGPPGIGKTRLLQALGEQVEPAGAVLWGSCLAYGEGITYWPIEEILREAGGIRHDDDPAVVAAKLAALIEVLDTRDQDELRTIATAVANLLGVRTTPRGTYSAEEIGQAELHWGLRRALHLLAQKRPLLLVLDDLHWAEPTLLDLVRELVSGADVPLAVVTTSRPDAGSQTPPAPADVIELEPLDAGASEALVRGLLGAEHGAAAVDELLARAGGNPLFLEEISRALAEAGPAERGRLPDTLQALIGSRLDGLPAGAKRTAQHASVAGTVFWAGALGALDGQGGAAADELQTLERRDVVHEERESTIAGEREYAFKHVLIRDVAYDRLPKGRRVDLHARFADWLAALETPGDEFVEIVAYHLEQACLFASAIARSPIEPPVAAAVEALTRSAERAERREGNREADRFYARALELVDEADEAAVDLRLRRCVTRVALGEVRDAPSEFLDVAAAAERVGRPDLRCRALLGYVNAANWQGRVADARQYLSEASSLAQEVGDPLLQTRALFELAELRSWFEGESAAAATDLATALELAGQAGDQSLLVEAHMRLGSLHFNAGRIVAAESHLAGAVDLAAAEGSFRDEARATSLLGFAKSYLGQRAEAERLALQALEWLERTGDGYLQTQNLRALAKYALERGDAALAERRLLEAVPLALESGGWLIVEVYRYLVEALTEQGRGGEAGELVGFSARNLPEEDTYARAMQRLAEGIVAAAEGDRSRTATAFTEAVDLFGEQGFVTDLAEARLLFARSLVRLREPRAAERELAAAREELAEAEAPGLLAAIERELDGLREPAP
jgi:tetratricopeptide (TPR) repeat protein